MKIIFQILQQEDMQKPKGLLDSLIYIGFYCQKGNYNSERIYDYVQSSFQEVLEK